MFITSSYPAGSGSRGNRGAGLEDPKPQVTASFALQVPKFDSRIVARILIGLYATRMLSVAIARICPACDHAPLLLTSDLDALATTTGISFALRQARLYDLRHPAPKCHKRIPRGLPQSSAIWRLGLLLYDGTQGHVQLSYSCWVLHHPAVAHEMWPHAQRAGYAEHGMAARAGSAVLKFFWEG